MDGNQSQSTKTVADVLEIIKTKMPKTYLEIRQEAARIGNTAFEYVRRGIRGEANMFWAMENGHVVGTPFSDPAIQSDVAAAMVRFGACYVTIFKLTPKD